MGNDNALGKRRGQWPRRLIGIPLLLLAALLAAEIALQVASAWAPDRSAPGSAGASYRVLCVGDSHTWGAGVDRSESYPGQLQRILDNAEPGLFSVMNLGVPGINTAQLRNRVPEWLSRHAPDVLVVWAGVNNAWNSAEVGNAPNSLLAGFDRQLLRSRLYRLARVRLHDRTLERYSDQGPEDRLWDVVGRRGAPGPIDRHIVKHDGVIEVFEHHKGSPNLDGVEQRAIEDFGAIARYAEAASSRMILITYPVPASSFVPANRAMCAASHEFGSGLVSSAIALARIPVEDREWLWALHPGAGLYGEIAQDVAAAVLDPSRAAPQPYECEPDYDAQRLAALRAIKSVAAAAGRGEQEQGAFANAVQALLPGSGLATLEPIEPAELADRLRNPAGRSQLLDLLRESAKRGEAGADASALIERYARVLGASRGIPRSETPP